MARYKVYQRGVSCLFATLLCGTTLSCRGIVDEQAEQVLLSKIGKTSFTVFPSFIRSKDSSFDRSSRTELMKVIQDEHFGTAIVVEHEVPIHGPWRHNQARMLRESAMDFGAYLKSNPVNTDYAVMAECLMGSREVIGAHLYVLDGDGRVAAVILANSHHKAFSSRSPKTAADCHAVIEEILQNDWSQNRAEIQQVAPLEQ